MFRTELHIPSSPYQIGLSSRVVTAGSCFSDVVGNKLRQYKVETLVNPFGTIFNPVSLCRLVEMACSENFDAEERLVENQGIWYHYDLHSSFSSPDQEALVERINGAMKRTRDFLGSAQLLVLTFGTAYGYFLKDDGEVVANCHKIPEQQFERRLLTYYEMVDAFGGMCAQLKMLNPDLKIVLTVSPVRHLRDTIPLNSISKANLRVACHHISENFPDVAYFPSYEVMMDDLRDYRFYKDDMIHPSPMAENYIWEKFSAAYCNPDFHAFLPEWDQIRRALAHKPFHPQSKGHQNFLRDTLDKLHRLRNRVNVLPEIEEVKRQLTRREGPEPARRPERPAPERAEENERPRPAPQRETRPEEAHRPVPAPQPVEEQAEVTPPVVAIPEAAPDTQPQVAHAKSEPGAEVKLSKSQKARNRRKKSKEGQAQGEPRPTEALPTTPENTNQTTASAPAAELPKTEASQPAPAETPDAPAPRAASASRPLKFIADRKKRNQQERPVKPFNADAAPTLPDQTTAETEPSGIPTEPNPTTAPLPEVNLPGTQNPVAAPSDAPDNLPEPNPETPAEPAPQQPAAVTALAAGKPKPRPKRAPAKPRPVKPEPATEPLAPAPEPAMAEVAPPVAPAEPPAPSTPVPKAKKAAAPPRKPRKPPVKKVTRPTGAPEADAGEPGS